MLQTEATINRILGLPSKSDVAADFLRVFPIHTDQNPTVTEMREWARKHALPGREMAPHFRTLKQAIQLARAFDADKLTLKEQQKASCPDAVARLLMPDLRHLKQEVLVVVALDTQNNPIAREEIYRGTLNASVIHAREVFAYAIEKRAQSIILAHNHPSGDPEPSDDDIRTTKRLMESGKLLDISVTDHIIIGDGIWYSMKQEGIL